MISNFEGVYRWRAVFGGIELRRTTYPFALVFVSSLALAMILCLTPLIWYIRIDTVLDGRVDADMRNKASWVVYLPGPVRVNSSGGDATEAFLIAQMIYKHNKDIKIVDECSSACAEFFMPAAKQVYASDDALIGYHISDMLMDGLLPAKRPESKYCHYQRLSWLKKIYLQRGLNPNFAKIVFKKLEFDTSSIEVSESDEHCLTSSIISKKVMWFPTSAQLRNYLNLDIHHDICADNQSCWKAKLDSASIGKEKFVVGDTPYDTP